jgi:hypothetical protein
MTRRALLVGAQTFGLAGPDRDVAAMATGLARHGFTDIRRCVGPDAVRDGIIAAYERFIASTEAGDVALVYYSGHGSYVRPLSGEVVEVASNNRQFIVPTDFREPPGDDFRGITAVELSVLLGRLTRKTTNAVVVLDCCHSAMMSRTLGTQVPKQLTRATVLDLVEHLRRRLGAGMPIELSNELGNEHAVRIVACGAEEVAYEQRRWDGSGSYGLLTDAFLRALDEAVEVPVSWSRLVDRIRRLVQEEAPHQRPEIEGPAERRLFEEEPDNSAGSLPAVQVGDRVRLPGASLLGVQAGDRFTIMSGRATRAAADGCLATVEIDRCDPEAASGTLRLTASGTTLPAGARAFRTRAVAPRVAVQVPARLREAVGACTFARAAAAGEDAPFQVVESADGGLVLHDRFGPLHRAAAGRADHSGLVASIERTARATVLREIRGERGWSKDAPVDIEWGRVHDGKRRPLPLSGAEVAVGEPVYIDVHNRGDDLYVSLVDVGVSYGITLITQRAGSGDHFDAESSYTFGWDRNRKQLTGRRLSWPEGVDPVATRPETVLVFVTTRPYDLTSLIQLPVRGESRSTEPNGLLAHFLSGTSREFEEVETWFWVRSVEFTLNPSVREAS